MFLQFITGAVGTAKDYLFNKQANDAANKQAKTYAEGATTVAALQDASKTKQYIALGAAAVSAVFLVLVIRKRI